jgi:hypothetical protein
MGLPIPWLPLIMDRYLMDRKGIGIRKDGIERIIRVRGKNREKLPLKEKHTRRKNIEKVTPHKARFDKRL